ncbi:NAD(P)/FAD-dependent oxidoreductase [Dactylosporangium fulvum]|uniref:Pyridine nucleotide-disulfide oxidoreductase domain-containing protein 2 n=1 Tax=Dactylosporangium fulvum TaxID=53359 RepID=A0ABY5W5I9_9ACTN|nr:NAD(P)/FAD-dependent oxidoreductase [Dactylosporangium fulvum]UWP83351.1 NAD(P)/FAD-dependent oxidoreductase [Dactylosporangium fulvum]
MTETVDAVVVGAGHNGLVAANLLADAGWDVVVLEATEHVGGAVRSGEILPGFVNDLCSSFYPLGAASPVLRQLDLESHGLRWSHAPEVVAHLFPDGRAAVLSRELDLTAESLDAFAPGDGGRFQRLYRQWRRLADDLVPSLLTPFPPIRSGARLVARAGLGGALRLGRRFLIPARALGEELFRGDGGRMLLVGLALHTDLAPDDAASGGFGWLLAMLGQQHGFPVPAGGAQQLTDALVRRFDGVVHRRALVDRVIVGGGRALGVRCADGRLFRARRAVLADVPAPSLYRSLVDAGDLPPRLLEDLEGFRWDNPTLKIDWALSGPVPWIAPEVGRAGTVHLGAEPYRYAADLALGRPPEEPFLLVGQMTTADPTRSPAGTETLWAYTHLPPGVRPDEVDAQVGRVEDTLRRHAPGFGDLVLERHVAGPADLEAKNPSLVDGAINGGTASAYQQLVWRPVTGPGRADTPIDRLFLASSSAHPGGGVHGAAGANAARAALARHRPLLGDVYATGMRAAMRAIYR